MIAITPLRSTTMNYDLEDLTGPETGEIDLITVGTGEGASGNLTNLQMVLVTSSMNHEYTLKAYEKCRSFSKKQELLTRMSHLKKLYYAARHQLATIHPDRLQILEQELNQQKQTVLSDSELH